MIVLDFSIVSIALPAIQRQLRFEAGDLQWVISAYTIIFAGFLMVAGRLSDLFGRRFIFLLGLFIFTGSSCVAGFAQTPTFLVIMRGLQGLGAAMVNPAALALVTDLYDEGEPRNRALGLWGVIGSAGLTGGILLGGLLTSALGWRAVFFVNVPIGVALMILTPFLVERDVPASKESSIDYAGALFLTAGTLLFIFAIEEIAQDGWFSASTVVRLAGAFVLLGTFFFIEKRVANPVVPLDLFKLPNVCAAALAGLFQAAAYAALFVYASLYFQNAMHWPAWKAALAFLPMSVLLTVLAGPYSARLATRFGARTIGLASTALMIVGAAIMTLINPATPYLIGALPGTVIAGFGDMLTYQMSMMIGLAHLPKAETGGVSGLLSSSIQIGLSLGVAVGGTLVESAVGTRGAFYSAIVFSVFVTLAFVAVRPIGAAVPGMRGLRGHGALHHGAQATLAQR